MPLTVPEYFEIQDVNGNTSALISPGADGVKEAWPDARLNAESTFEFRLPLTSEKWDEITPECRIVAGGREYVILHDDAIDTERDKQGRLWGKVMARESWVLMDKDFVTVSNDPQNPDPADLQVSIISGGAAAGGYPQGSAGSALTYLLSGSEWSVGTVDVDGVHDLETEKMSRLQNIKKVQEIWGGYLVWDSINKTVSLRDESKWQPYNGFQVRYGKNLQHITRTQHNGLVTRLYPFGENNLDISSVNGGVKYLDNNTYTPNIYVGLYQNQEITDAQELMDEATKVLAKLCEPRYTYRVSLTDVRVLPEYNHEDYTLGDMADVVDPTIGTDRVRIVRHKYNLFMPWKCDLEIGEPEERLESRLASSFDASEYVQKLLKPNPATSNLLKGFVDTFATQINSANGKLVWNDSTLEAIEIDGNGAETGKRVRITPGGIGISTDGGQTFTTAMTGAGVLANTIIASEIYALSSADGFTKLVDSGLKVFDNLDVLRVHLGQYQAGKFGLKLLDPNGSQTILDENGILQTWQAPWVDNVDSTHPLVLNVFVPAETKSIKKALLRFKRQKFRAYETATSSGGGSTSGASSSSTTASGGGDTSGGGSWFTEADYTSGMTATDFAGSHDHSGETSWSLPSIPSGYDHYHDYRNMGNAGSHTHVITLNHRHTVYSHTHGMAHTHSTPNHTHGIAYGIYEDSLLATGITVKINGTDRTAALGGGTGFTTDQNSLDISNYLTIGQLNIIELTPANLSRIDATVFIQAMMGV